MRLNILLWIVAMATAQLDSAETDSSEGWSFNGHFSKYPIKRTASYQSFSQVENILSHNKALLFLRALVPKLEHSSRSHGNRVDYQIKGPLQPQLTQNVHPIPKRQTRFKLIENENTSLEIKEPPLTGDSDYTDFNISNVKASTSYFNKDVLHSSTLATTTTVRKLTVMAAQIEQFLPSVTDATEVSDLLLHPGYMSTNSESEIGNMINVTVVSGSVDGSMEDSQGQGLTKAQIIAIVTCLSLVGIVFLVAAAWRIRNYCKKLREEGVYQNRRNMKRINSSDLDRTIPEIGSGFGSTGNPKISNSKLNQCMLAEIDEFGEEEQMMHPLINQSNETSTISPTPLSNELKPLISTSSPSSYHSRFEGTEGESELNDFDYQMPEDQYSSQDNISRESDDIPGTPLLSGFAQSDTSISITDNPSYCYGNQIGYFSGSYGYEYSDAYSLECLDSGYITNPCQCSEEKSDLLSLPGDLELQFKRGNFENSFRWSTRSPRSSIFARLNNRERKISNSSTHSLPNTLEMGAKLLDMDSAGIPLLNVKRQSGSLPIDLSSITPDILSQVRQTGKNFFEKDTAKTSNPIKFERLQEDELQMKEPVYLTENDETLLMDSQTFENEEL